MRNILIRKNHWINIGLFIVGIVIALLYSVCEESCTYLQGSIFGVKLNYLGILFMGVLALSNLLKRNAIFLILLSFGIGAELYLIGFQIMNSMYCSYCLSFGVLSSYLNGDNIKSTPTYIIENKGKKQRFTGADIATALNRLQ